MAGEQDHSMERHEEAIRVVARVRPLTPGEELNGHHIAVSCLEERTVQLLEEDTDGRGGAKGKSFTLNCALDVVGQGDFFRECGIRELLDSTIEGYSNTCFAYGQTGSGKTYSLVGPEGISDRLDQKPREGEEEEEGLVSRAVKYLFSEIKKRNHYMRCKVDVSYCEIYNEKVRDLLTASDEALSVKHNPHEGFYVHGSTKSPCASRADVMRVFAKGFRRATTSSHAMNQRSNRSHTILTINVHSSRKSETTAETRKRHGRMCFVDLAGSERAKDTHAEGRVLHESCAINKSLFTLGKVISSLSERRGGVIPYRDSTLTKLLQSSLGGTCKTLMIACCSPSLSHMSETARSLEFAARAKNVKNRPVVVLDPKEALIVELRQEIARLRKDNRTLMRASADVRIDRDEMCELGLCGEDSGQYTARSINVKARHIIDEQRRRTTHPEDDFEDEDDGQTLLELRRLLREYVRDARGASVQGNDEERPVVVAVGSRGSLRRSRGLENADVGNACGFVENVPPRVRTRDLGVLVYADQGEEEQDVQVINEGVSRAHARGGRMRVCVDEGEESVFAGDDGPSGTRWRARGMAYPSEEALMYEEEARSRGTAPHSRSYAQRNGDPLVFSERSIRGSAKRFTLNDTMLGSVDLRESVRGFLLTGQDAEAGDSRICEPGWGGDVGGAAGVGLGLPSDEEEDPGLLDVWHGDKVDALIEMKALEQELAMETGHRPHYEEIRESLRNAVAPARPATSKYPERNSRQNIMFSCDDGSTLADRPSASHQHETSSDLNARARRLSCEDGLEAEARPSRSHALSRGGAQQAWGGWEECEGGDKEVAEDCREYARSVRVSNKMSREDDARRRGIGRAVVGIQRLSRARNDGMTSAKEILAGSSSVRAGDQSEDVRRAKEEAIRSCIASIEGWGAAY